MEAREILKWARKEPFTPFVVILQSGTRVPVNHPEEIFFLPDPARVENIEVYSGELRFVFGPTGVTAIKLARRNGNGTRKPRRP